MDRISTAASSSLRRPTCRTTPRRWRRPLWQGGIGRNRRLGSISASPTPEVNFALPCTTNRLAVLLSCPLLSSSSSLLLPVNSPAIPAQAPVSSDDAVAWDHDGDWIRGAGSRYRTSRRGLADGRRNFAIGAGSCRRGLIAVHAKRAFERLWLGYPKADSIEAVGLPDVALYLRPRHEAHRRPEEYPRL